LAVALGWNSSVYTADPVVSAHSVIVCPEIVSYDPEHIDGLDDLRGTENLPGSAIDLLAVEVGDLASQHASAEVFVITPGDQTEPHRNRVVACAGASIGIHRHALEQSLGLVSVGIRRSGIVIVVRIAI